MPTLRTWIAFACVALALSWASVSYLHDFLAPMGPAAGARVLVIEAGPSPGLVRYVESLLATGQYTRIIPVGTPIDRLSTLASFGTDADLWEARLLRVGVPRQRIEVVRVPGLVRHRTAHKALAVRRHLDRRPTGSVDLVSPGMHARRSFLIYERALGQTRVGILSAPQPYDMKRWWNSSAGVRAAVGELLALGYFYFGRDEVELARADWNNLTEDARQVDGPDAAAQSAAEPSF